MLQTVGKDDGSSPRFQRPKMHPRIAGAEEAITHHGPHQKTAKELSYGAGVANQGNPLKSPWQDILVGELGPEHLYPCPELDEGLGLSVGIVGPATPWRQGKALRCFLPGKSRQQPVVPLHQGRLQLQARPCRPAEALRGADGALQGTGQDELRWKALLHPLRQQLGLLDPELSKGEIGPTLMAVFQIRLGLTVADDQKFHRSYPALRCLPFYPAQHTLFLYRHWLLTEVKRSTRIKL